jgi:MFS transporter, FHS family, L-fucose permease
MSMNSQTEGLSKRSYIFSLTIIGIFYFIFGFVTWLNSTLILFLKTACELTNFQAYFVTAAFYISYFVMALPASAVLKKTGFKIGMSVGLWVMAAGALIFVPAALSRNYAVFLIGLFVQGTGLSLLQTAVNPYVTIIGPRESAARRISIMGIANKLAGAIAPILLTSVLLKDSEGLKTSLTNAIDTAAKNTILNELALRVISPYIIMAVILVALGFLLKLAHLPEVDTDAEDEATGTLSATKKNIFQYPHLVVGVVALFFYVGVEVIAGDSIMRYGQSLGVSDASFKYFASLTMLSMIIGYVTGIILIPKYLKQVNALRICASLGIIFSLAAIFVPAGKMITMPFRDLVTFQSVTLTIPVTVLFIALLGLANSLVWPAIFPLALEGLGRFTKTGSAMLIMAIVGGALIPLAYGKLADIFTTQTAYWICVPSYVVILYYALHGYRLKGK